MDQNPPNQNPAPGWYPDPTQPGTQRYWDGEKWTEHSAPLQQQSQVGQGWDAGGGYGVTSTGPVTGIDPWFWQSIAATILCCLPAGIAGIVFSARAKEAINRGDATAAREAADKARMWTLISAGVGLVFAVLYFVFALAVGLGGGNF